MSDKIVHTNIEILGKYYSIRCPESEVKALQEASAYLNQKMQDVQESGKAINLERIAIMAALNVAHDFLQTTEQKTSLMDKINQKITHIQDKIENIISNPEQVEFVYSAE